MRFLSRRLALGGLALVTGLAVAPAGAVSSPARVGTSLRAPVPGAQRIPGGWAVPTSTRGPSWYNRAFYRKVLASGPQGVRLPAGATLPDGTRPPSSGSAKAAGLVSIGIRPGTWLITLKLTTTVGFAWCTANFVFANGGTKG